MVLLAGPSPAQGHVFSSLAPPREPSLDDELREASAPLGLADGDASSQARNLSLTAREQILITQAAMW